MPTHAPKESLSRAPFIELLNDAEDVEIRQISDGSAKIYQVAVKPKAPPPPKNEAEALPDSYPREYVIRNADLLLQGEEFILARNLYSFVLQNDVRDPDALRGLGVSLFRLGDTTAAKKCFKALWELHGREDCLVWLGQCLVIEKNDAAAIEHFRKVKAPQYLSKADQFELYRELGNALTRQTRYEEADQAYKTALEIRPGSDSLYVNLGMLEIQRFHFELARSYFHRALQLNSSNAKAHCGLGLVAMESNNAAEARREFSRSLDLDSQNLIALLQLLALTENRPETSHTQKRLEAFLARDSRNEEIRYALAALLFRDGNYDECQAQLDLILKKNPDHKNALKLREEISGGGQQA